jgi:hypothetical protein
VTKSERIRSHKFSVGEAVRVRSKETISQGLDLFNRLEGCLMMDQMWEYCGQRLNVIKVVNNVFDESRYKMLETRFPLYLLEGVICRGTVNSFEHKCDRSCYLVWHGEWLQSI